ncbi:MAG: hypothetical protein CMK59_14070 [Proteobacteria bacterium]|nr:hypothetical protein [Pseudomonadota bacterium]
MRLKLLINPMCKSAYFSDFLSVAEEELTTIFPGIFLMSSTCGGLQFLHVDCLEKDISKLARLSFVQGIFEETKTGLQCVDVSPEYLLPEGVVWGDKYRGKTNETVTQLGLNLALHFCASKTLSLKLLDPMAGRGTTLFWAARYGIEAVGIEQNKDAIEHFHRHIKKQCKIHRIKHKLIQGQLGKKQKNRFGSFREVQWAQSKIKLIIGDSAQLSLKPSFNMIVTDLPYGIQFTGSQRRNPIDVLESCASNWIRMLQAGGAVVLMFNAFQPSREQLRGVFSRLGLEEMSFSGSHRMSESIKREILILKKP